MSIKVLVADDSITIQKVIGIIFGGDEYSLTVVDNGKAAVEKALEIIPDILLIDALMPGMTGYEVAETVRSTPSLSDKPILILTGSFEPFDEEKAKKCGADDFISKPFESQQIIAKVKELLELGGTRTKSAAVSQQQPAPEIISEQIPEVSAPTNDIPAPVLEQQQSEPTDIWGAFSPEVEAPNEAVAVPPVFSSPPLTTIEPDVFAIVSEEEDVQLVQPVIPSASMPQHTGSQWIPVEENTFEFEEEAIKEPLQEAFSDQVVPAQETAFGDIAFEYGADTPTAPEPEPTVQSPAFADFVAPSPVFETPAAPFAPLVDPSPVFTAPVEPAVLTAPPITDAVAASATLTEEQLKAALTSASKEVIERIVWEIVPDLAEVLIREAIRKIKEEV